MLYFIFEMTARKYFEKTLTELQILGIQNEYGDEDLLSV